MLGGAVSEALLNKCFGKLAAYVRLVVQTVRAEFPDFELIQAFSVLALDPAANLETKANLQSIEKLAAVFRVEGPLLLMQLKESRPYALKRKWAENLSDLSAWELSIRPQMKYDVSRRPNELALIVSRSLLFAACCGTPKNERVFAQHTRHYKAQRAMLTPRQVDAEMRLRSESHNEDELIKKAMAVWREGFGKPRLSKKSHPRWFNGLRTIRQKSLKSNLSEKEWLRQRRAQITASLSSCYVPLDSASASLVRIMKAATKASRGEWSEEHQEVVCFVNQFILTSSIAHFSGLEMIVLVMFIFEQRYKNQI